MEAARTTSLTASVVLMGLIAGLFYAYSMSVMPALARSSDRTLVETMQSINRAILNGWFALIYGGSVLITAVATVLYLSADDKSALPWIIAGLVLYIAVLVITAVFNVPLNNELDAAGDPDKITDLAEVRERFEAAWVRWNIVRTIFNVAAFGALVGALIVHARDAMG